MPEARRQEKRGRWKRRMNLKTLFESPNQFLLAFEPPNAVFSTMDVHAYRRSIFLDGRISPRTTDQSRIRFDQLIALQAQRELPTPKLSWIFHIAHCGSTLLARALDLPGETFVLREPLALRQISAECAAHFGIGPRDAEWQSRLNLVVQLLTRRYEPTDQVIVKANVPVNFIVPDLLKLAPADPSIVLYFSLENYLTAILRSPNHRKWVANIIRENRRAIEGLAPLNENLSLAEFAAALWLAQMRVFALAQSADPNIASLDAEYFFNQPRASLEAAFTHVGRPQTDGRLDAIVSSELFSTYSKNPTAAFDNEARLARRKALAEPMREELTAARRYVEAARRTHPIPDRLARPLGGEAPLLVE
jgi:hypothetical protein